MRTSGPLTYPEAHRNVKRVSPVARLRPTITGVAPALRREFPGILLVAVEPESCPVLSGGLLGPTRIQGIGAGFVPPVLDRAAYDRVERVSGAPRKGVQSRREGTLTEPVLAGVRPETPGPARALAGTVALKGELAVCETVGGVQHHLRRVMCSGQCAGGGDRFPLGTEVGVLAPTVLVHLPALRRVALVRQYVVGPQSCR